MAMPTIGLFRFYDPTRPLTDNRWVRYGLGGIAESYMEGRLPSGSTNLGLNYRLPFRHNLQSDPV